MSEQSSVQEEAKPTGFAETATGSRLGGRASNCCGAKYFAKGLCHRHYDVELWAIEKQKNEFLISLPINDLVRFLKHRGNWI